MPKTNAMKKLGQRRQLIGDLTIRSVNERMAKHGSLTRRDVVGNLIDLRNERSDIKDVDIWLAAVELAVAGSDTTSLTLSMLFHYLATHLDVYAKLKEEIASIQTKDQYITLRTARENMPYLQAVIKETLRMYPVVGYHLPRVVPPGGKIVAGRFLKGGVIVGMNAWITNRNQTIFGDDANEFRPERWMVVEQQVAAMDRYILTFGGGSRTCVSLPECFKTVVN